MSTRKRFLIASGLIVLFLIYTAAITRIDVQAFGPRGSSVGFATVNQVVHNFFGVSMLLYEITDWLGLVALVIALGFAILGLTQWIRRRKLLRVDYSILTLGVFYLVVIFAYVFFEYYVINYRPVLIDGFLEASYPSSTTLLILCIVPTAMLQFHRLIRHKMVRMAVNVMAGGFAAIMIVGRLLSGVHWMTDILGSVLLSSALVVLYDAVNRRIDPKWLERAGK